VTLPDVLKKYCQLESPKGGWRLVIVDNGSKDSTREIIASFRPHLPLTYLYEPRQGKNVALNTALPTVSGDLVVFTDDDILPQSNWLKLLRSAADSNPSFAIFGGSILPKWDSPPEEWLTAWVPLSPTFGVLNSLNDGPIKPNFVFGGNMAIRASIFERGYRFNEAIGPKGLNYAMGSEIELLMRLAQEGFQSWHCKSAIVYHIIQSFQMREEWILARAVRYGRGQYRIRTKNRPEQALSLLGLPMPLLSRTVIQGFRVVRAKLQGNPERIFKARWQLKYLSGQVIESWLLSKKAHKNNLVIGLAEPLFALLSGN
jgi:glycosyltransferase involved in cell wall biosynthesis